MINRPARTALALAAFLIPPFAVPAEATASGAHGWSWMDRVRWVDAPAPRAEQLRDRIVLVEFWAADCINCRRTAPAMRALSALRDSGVVLIGVHTPELEDERSIATVRRAIADLGITWPVAQDNDYQVWRAFDNHYWPVLYVLDGRGEVRSRHIGELHVGTPAWDDLLRTLADLRRKNR
ncbi:MAG: redoxin domain-containing protein [Candidatus Eisenbacteria bacterium]|nr:redoxin domain-containing protein [Candidatus Eisenbacteria bacterium]